jgi:hypothetical protein
MIFVEHIHRDRSTPWEVFRKLGAQEWPAEDDKMIANLGRTMRLAPEPHYMARWQIASIARMDEWEDHFRKPEGRLYLAESPTNKALHFTRCGLYDCIIGAGPVPSGLHLVEYFTPDRIPSGDIERWFKERAAKAGAGQLTYVLTRLGHLAPSPGGIALWTFKSYVEAEPFLRATTRNGPMPITEAGLYRNFGEDIP